MSNSAETFTPETPRPDADGTRVPALPPAELRRESQADGGSEPSDGAAALDALNAAGMSPPTLVAGGVSVAPSPRLGPNDETLDAFLPSSSGGHEPMPERIGQYRIVRKVGEGGMGLVYEAEQLAPVRRTVALKVIKVGMDTKEVVARFDAERQALAMMNHAGVARVFDAGMTAAGRPYFAMEFVQGTPLVDYCDKNRLSTRQRLELFIAICSAVQHAHQKGIIHRDLKPSNILVTTVDEKPTPKVIDFGIAKATTQTLTDQSIHTMHGALIGTPEYASPEQAMTGGLDVDTRADIYSLGVILYQLLTGTLPLDSRTLMRDGPGGIARVIREVEPPKPSTRLHQLRRDDPTLPGTTTFAHVVQSRGADHKSLPRQLQGDLDWITLKAMEKDRARRYATAAELADDISRHLADEPVLARPPSTRYRLVKFMRRHRVGVAAAAVMVLLLAGGMVGTSTGMIRAWVAQAQAETARTEADGQRKQAQSALEQLQRARALAQQETRKSIIAGLAAAEQLLPARAQEAERLAEPAYRAAAAELGQDDALTLDAADVLARVRLAMNQPADAETLLRDVVERVRRLAMAPATSTVAAADRITPPGRYFSDLALAIRARERGSRSAATQQEIISLYRESLSAFRNDPADTTRLRLDVGTSLASMLVADNNLPAAEQAWLDTLADHRALLGEKHERTRSVADRLLTVRVAADRFPQALEIAKGQLALATELAAATDEPITRRLDIADILLRMGRKADARAAFGEAVAESRRRRSGADGPNQIRWRYLVMRAGLGDVRRWSSPYLRAHAWVAVNEALARSGTRDFAADEVDLAAATFTIERWNGGDGSGGNASTSIAAGSLDALRQMQTPPPGVYLLSLAVPRGGPSTMRAATWMLMADWDVSLFQPTGPILPSQRGATFWNLIHGRAAQQSAAPSLFFLDEGNYGERLLGMRVSGGPGGRTTDFAASGVATIALPPGRYLAAVTADDGVNFAADGKTLINDWRMRVLQTDVTPIEFDTSPRTLKVDFFQGFGDYSLRLQLEPLDAHADVMMARALGPDTPDHRRWLLRRGQWRERLAQWQASADSYRKAIEVGVQLPWTENETHLQALRGFGRASAQAGVAEKTAGIVEGMADKAHAAEVEAETLLYAARLRSLSGGRESSDGDNRAGYLCDLAIHAIGDKSRTDPRFAELGRRAVLTRLGAPRIGNDGGLTAQVLSALDEAMIEERSLIAALKGVRPGDVRWKLVRWNPPENPVVAEGTFADIAGVTAPPPGIYLLQLRIAGAPVHTSAHWLLFARWQWSAFVPETEGMFDRFALGGLIGNPNRAVGQGESDSLSMLDSLATEPIPDSPDIRYALVADTRLRLPAGAYRVIGSAADGLKVHVDDRRVIHTWPARQAVRQDVADIVLSGVASNTVRVEHYRTGGDDKLMLRLAPVGPAADALAAMYGRKPRQTDDVIRELDEAVREDSFHGWAFGTRGALHARAGRFDEAASDFAVAIEIDANEPLWQSHQAMLALLRDGDGGLAKAIGGWRRQSLPEKDRTAAARAAIVMLLRKGRPDAEREKLDAVMGVATVPAPLGGTPPSARFARALMEYRLGKLESAETLATSARSMTASPGHQVMCDLLLSMICHDAGRQKESAAHRASAEAAIKTWSTATEPHDPFDALDWMICQALMR